MITVQLDSKGIEAQIDAVRGRIRATTAHALINGFAATVRSTPEDTGFLRASWFISVDGNPSSHPNPPSADLKATLPYKSGRHGDFVAVYEAMIASADIGFSSFGGRDSAGRFQSAAFSIQTISYINNAPYVDKIDVKYSLEDKATLRASDAIHNTFARNK